MYPDNRLVSGMQRTIRMFTVLYTKRLVKRSDLKRVSVPICRVPSFRLMCPSPSVGIRRRNVGMRRRNPDNAAPDVLRIHRHRPDTPGCILHTRPQRIRCLWPSKLPPSGRSGRNLCLAQCNAPSSSFRLPVGTPLCICRTHRHMHCRHLCTIDWGFPYVLLG